MEPGVPILAIVLIPVNIEEKLCHPKAGSSQAPLLTDPGSPPRTPSRFTSYNCFRPILDPADFTYSGPARNSA